MKTYTKPLFLTIFFLFISVQLGLCRSLKPLHAFDIDTVTLGTGSFQQVGDTIQLNVKVRSLITGSATVHLRFPGLVAPPDQQSGETGRDSIISVDSGSIYNIGFPMKLFGHGGSSIDVAVYPTIEIPGIKNEICRSIEIEHSSTAFSVYDFSANKHDTVACSIYHNTSSIEGSLTITGKVNFPNFYSLNTKEGVYGVTVVLLFHKKDVAGGGGELGGFKNFFHPMIGCENHIHKCKTDVNGNFSFYFVGQGSWSDFVDVTLLVTNSNDACLLKSAPSFIIPSTTCGWETFDKPYTAILPIEDDYSISYSNVEITLDQTDGGILRYMELAREFARVRPVGVEPSQIRAKQESLPSPIVGEFDPTSSYPEIHINPGYGGPITVCHEYGHYTHFSLTPGTFTNTDEDFVEGFAEFHQFAVRNYINSTYGEYLEWEGDNQEESPFIFGGRFYGIPYLFSSYAPNAAAFSCFLWGVYDRYVDPGFKYSHYAGGDNDDVPEPTLIYDKLNGLTSHPTMGSFNTALQNSVNVDEAVSIGKIYTNMMSDVSTKMRPAQIKNLIGHVTQVAQDHYEIGLYWSNQMYTNTSWIFSANPVNLADGIHVYQSGGDGGWNLVATLSPSAGGYSIATNIGTTMYKVSTYNSSGDACLAPVAIPVADKIAFDNNNFERTKVHNSILTCASNPFINIANIVLDISMSAYGQIEVFDLVGRQLMIQNFERNEAGKFSINFDGSQYPAQTFVCRAKIHFADGVYQEKEISILEIK